MRLDPSPTMKPALELNKLAVSLDGRPVLHDLSLQVMPGEFVVLLGANGSGKSTLVRASIGLIPHQGGTISWFGAPLGSFRDWRRIGYVPQRLRATAGVPATVREVVMSGRLSRRRFFGFADQADRDAVASALERVNMNDRANSPVANLSGGQQQRVLIARALANEADILVMDEPTAGVDHDNVESLARLLAELTANGTAIFLVAHELGPLRPLIDRAIVLDGGNIAFNGPVNDLVGQVSRLAGDDHDHVHQLNGTTASSRTIFGRGSWR